MNNSKVNTENGGVAGPPTSSLDAVARSIPTTGIDFGYCSVSLETHRRVVLDNTVPRSVNGQSIRYSIETDSPNFTVSHSNGKYSIKH
jgi:hypothetical protein